MNKNNRKLPWQQVDQGTSNQKVAKPGNVKKPYVLKPDDPFTQHNQNNILENPAGGTPRSGSPTGSHTRNRITSSAPMLDSLKRMKQMVIDFADDMQENQTGVEIHIKP